MSLEPFFDEDGKLRDISLIPSVTNTLALNEALLLEWSDYLVLSNVE